MNAPECGYRVSEYLYNIRCQCILLYNMLRPLDKTCYLLFDAFVVQT